jgi:arsenate reductase
MADILFLCTGNSCRSQMAEGWARHLGGQHRIASAGIQAHGLNPNAVRVMLESGVDISAQDSNTIDEFSLADFDQVVTVCGDADQKCPALPPGTNRIHWPLSDPAKFKGSAEETLDEFRSSRDEIRVLVKKFLADLA